MKITIAPLFSKVPPFFKETKYLSISLGFFIALLILSYLYLSKVDQVFHKKIELSIDGESAMHEHKIGDLNILIGINSTLFKKDTHSYGFLSVEVSPPNNIKKSISRKEWYDKYHENVYYMSNVEVKSNFELPLPTDFKDSIGLQLVERSFNGFNGILRERFDVIELTDTCVKIKHLMIDESTPEIFYLTFDTDIANTAEAPWYKPIDISTICFSLKVHSRSLINKGRLVITYSSPLNIMTISPEPDKMTASSIVYEDSLKIEQIFYDGFYILAQDITRLHHNNMKSFWSATILGACISIIAEILFRIIESRKKKQVSPKKVLKYRKRKSLLGFVKRQNM